MNHTCHAENCTVKVHPRLLMCREHWSMVPKPLQDKVWATYRRGQEVDKKPSPAYLEAAIACVRYIAEQERGSVIVEGGS